MGRTPSHLVLRSRHSLQAKEIFCRLAGRLAAEWRGGGGIGEAECSPLKRWEGDGYCGAGRRGGGVVFVVFVVFIVIDFCCRGGVAVISEGVSSGSVPGMTCLSIREFVKVRFPCEEKRLNTVDYDWELEGVNPTHHTSKLVWLVYSPRFPRPFPHAFTQFLLHQFEESV